MDLKLCRPVLAAALAAFGLLASARAQAQTGAAAVRALVEAAVPQWSAGVFEAPAGPDWSAELTFAGVGTALGDAPFPLPAPGVTRVRDGARVARLERPRGLVRYVNAQRRFQLERDGGRPPAGDALTLAAVGRALRDLGLPAAERGTATLTSEMEGTAPHAAPEQLELRTLYRFVYVPRVVAGLPVEGSRVTAAVNASGDVQRLLVAWPRFVLAGGLEPRSRRAVVDEAVAGILAQDPEPGLDVRAVLAYVTSDPEDPASPYVPAVVVSVLSKSTPYQLVVPLGARS